MIIKRNRFALLSAFGALASAGAAVVHAVEAVIHYAEDKFHLLHAETEQHCQFDDVAARDAFLAGVPDAHVWVDPLAKPALAPAAASGETLVAFDLGALRETVAADIAKEDAENAAASAAAAVGLPGNDAAPVIEQAPAAETSTETPAQ